MTGMPLLDWKPQEPSYPNAPAEGKTDTSRAAAKVIRQAHKVYQQMVLDELGRAPGTYKQISERLGLDSRTVQPRLSELRDLGLIRDSGKRYRGPDDRCSCIVWEVI
jgi:predicted transcriptional regulator